MVMVLQDMKLIKSYSRSHIFKYNTHTALSLMSVLLNAYGSHDQTKYSEVRIKKNTKNT